MTTTSERRRLRSYVTEYARNTWGVEIGRIGADQFLRMSLRADGYANAHVEGEHESNGICSFTSPRVCGERAAAAEFVETSTVDDEPTFTPTQGAHANCDHPSTKAARAACRRARSAAVTTTEEN
jgi:hypothetical protein